MSTPSVVVSREQARRFLVRALALDGFQSLSDVGAALQTLGFIQEDSINVCGRIHDLILWPRVAEYRPETLQRFLYETSPRPAWEYYLPNLCVLPVEDLPYFLPAMQRAREKESRWGKWSPEEEAAAQTLFAKLDADGPLYLRDTKEIGTEHGHTTSGWGTRTRMLSFVADKLFWQGRLGIARREGFLRAFDRIERLLPPAVVNAPLPDHEEAETHLLRKRMRARRLFRLRTAEKPFLTRGEVVPVTIEGDKRPWYVFASEIESLRSGEPVGDTLHLLAPLDPLVYDRDRNHFLWDFDYTWEVYVPAAKRKWGYYVLPILHGDRLVGRIEPRFDRKTCQVMVQSVAWEPGIDGAVLEPLLEQRLEDLRACLG